MKEKTERRKLHLRTHLQMSGDIESNPGPNCSLKVISNNVRGLNCELKLRHLINFCTKSNPGKNSDLICCFQETFIEKEGKLPYLWRGNLHLTPGNGNSLGCLTLTSSHLNIIETRNLGNRGHVIVCQKSGDQVATYIVANIYAPNSNTNEKLTFFESVFETVGELSERYGCSNCIVIGDFNLVFGVAETRNRNITVQEKRVADIVRFHMQDHSLSDIWENNPLLTWRRPNTDIMSCIDRVLYKKDEMVILKKSTNWSVTFSDHASLELEFITRTDPPKTRSRITRLDPTLMSNEKIRSNIEKELTAMISDVPAHWNPHTRLEYVKMCLRTIVESTQAELKRINKSEEDYLNAELDLAIKSLERDPNRLGVEELIEYIEELRSEKKRIIELKGEKLAEKLKTKWYGEGEKSTRYFLRLLNRSQPDDFKKIKLDDNTEILNEEEIQAEIVRFYKDLYENYDKGKLNTFQDETYFDRLTRIESQEAESVMKEIRRTELWEILKTCKDSAPGPDGIPYSYLKGLWSIFGELLEEAWKYSLETKMLTASHRVSFLKLIPKADKDLSKLTNWRPITLSNCDHKLITKTYAKRMSESISPIINGRQTAYLKGRLINDNIRSLLATINISNLEEMVDGLMISLDAKKAFDSVEHSYIETCLEKIGLGNFVPIFRILYSDLQSDIIINGKITKGYSILRGVKQGDALSCILFVICIEPLLCNIEANDRIRPVQSNALRTNLPKSYAYADDVTGCINNDRDSVQEFFNEYSRLTNLSGLELNADKTEIMRICKRRQHEPVDLDISYLGNVYRVQSQESTKINGIYFQQDVPRMVDTNVNNAIRRIEQRLKPWSRRSLSTLGKILLVKTFGISQIIFMLQSLCLMKKHFRALNAVLFKFIWNRNFLAAKAPERIKRDIVNKPIKLGGLGMIDLEELDASLKLRAIGRIMDTGHPFLSLLANETKLEQFFFPKTLDKVDDVTEEGIRLLKKDRWALLSRGPTRLDYNRKFIGAIKGTKLVNIVSELGKTSITFNLLWQQGKRLIGELSLAELLRLRHFINIDFYETSRRLLTLNGLELRAEENLTVFYEDKVWDLKRCTSKSIRDLRSVKTPIRSFKIGVDLETKEALTWGYNLSRLRSVRHRDTILRVVHGDVYSKERLFRFGLIDDPACPRCNEIETIRHRILDCQYSNRIAKELIKVTNQLRINAIDPDTVEMKDLLGITETNHVTLAVHAEVIQRILFLKENATYLLRPKRLVKSAIEQLIKLEADNQIKSSLRNLLLE